MGLFSRKKKTLVSSVCYNLAGPEDDRPDVLKTTVVSAVLSEQESLGNTITDAYLHGAGMRIRSFAKWARNRGYNSMIQLSEGRITSGDSINMEEIANHIVPTPGSTVYAQTAEIGKADYSYWADQFISENHPELLGTDYVVDIDDATSLITITYVDTTTESFIPINFDIEADYLYASYVEASGQIDGPIEVGDVITLGSMESFPDVSLWDEDSVVVTPVTVNLIEETVIDVTYSDATPPTHSESSTSTPTDYNEIHSVYLKDDVLPSPPGQDIVRVLKNTMYQDTVWVITQDINVSVVNEDIGGVIKTTTTTVTTDVLTIERSYRIDTQEVQYNSYTPTKVFIYKKGGGNSVLNAMFNPPTTLGSFLPFIPFRVNNGAVPDIWPNTLYPTAKKAFKRATGGKYDEVFDNIYSNASIGDIDYAYAVFGVSLNVKENACRKYIYNFFKLLNDDPTRKSALDYEDYVTAWHIADASWTEWIAWRGDPYDSMFKSRLRSEPERIPYPVAPFNSIRVASGSGFLKYDVTISWNFIEEEMGSGLLKPDAKAGDYWLTVGGPADVLEEQTWQEKYDDVVRHFLKVPGREYKNDLLYINWQVSPTSWKRLVIRGLNHENMIYNGKSVIIGSTEALLDPEESGFIIPLHEDVYHDIGLVDGTQMSTACCFLVFNCYQVVKTKWYQSGLFKVILVVIAVAIVIFSAGTGTPLSAGILGSSVAIGTGLGFAGTMALVVGTAVNAIAAMVLVALIQKAAIKLFGEKVGIIIGTIVGVLTLQVGTALQAGATLTSSFGNLLRADNLMMLMNSSANAYAEYINVATEDMVTQSMNLQNQFESELEKLSEKYTAEFGQNGILDPTQIADILLANNEPPESFLQRTLMVGSDIANLSIDMLHNFTKITLNTDL